jgi:hypothetical protein
MNYEGKLSKKKKKINQAVTPVESTNFYEPAPLTPNSVKCHF